MKVERGCSVGRILVTTKTGSEIHPSALHKQDQINGALIAVLCVICRIVTTD